MITFPGLQITLRIRSVLRIRNRGRRGMASHKPIKAKRVIKGQNIESFVAI